MVKKSSLPNKLQRKGSRSFGDQHKSLHPLEYHGLAALDNQRTQKVKQIHNKIRNDEGFSFFFRNNDDYNEFFYRTSLRGLGVDEDKNKFKQMESQFNELEWAKAATYERREMRRDFFCLYVCLETNIL